MSAFLVTPATLITAAYATQVAITGGVVQRVSPVTEALASAYLYMNRDAIKQRYPNDADMLWHNEIGTHLDFMPTGFLARDFVLHRAMSCLSYQCSEGDVPDSRLFEVLSNAISWFEGHHSFLTSPSMPHLWDLDVSEDGKHLLDYEGQPRDIAKELSQRSRAA
jgi:hypothetical protein